MIHNKQQFATKRTHLSFTSPFAIKTWARELAPASDYSEHIIGGAPGYSATIPACI
jgi:hypothetical protein